VGDVIASRACFLAAMSLAKANAAPRWDWMAIAK
jgi:hypothetical protein